MKNKLLKTIIMLSKCFLYGFVLQTLFLNLALALNANGQYKTIEEVRVTLTADQLTLDRFFREVQRQTPFKFSFENKDMERRSEISFSHKEGTVIDFLREVSLQTELSFRQINHGIDVLKRKGKEKAILSAPDPIIINGTVTDKNGAPIPGVTISLPSTSIGTATDLEGKYSLPVPEASTLVFSFIGFETQRVVVGTQSIINVVLSEDMASLDEVVVIGYGSQLSRNITGAISKIDMKETENLPNTNIGQALRGRLAGVQFLDNGRPGQSGEILVRGTKSLSASNSPLVVLDGMIFYGSLSDINPNDIQSIEVLKDASSSAIYGSRAANGVVLVTSKKGITAKPTINFNALYGISDYSYKVKLLDSESYIQEKIDVAREDGIEVNEDNIIDYLGPNEKENYLQGNYKDPWDMVSQNSYIATYNLNLSGRSEMSNYLLSASYSNEQGLILNDQQKRYTLRSNFNYQVTNWLSMGSDATYVNRDNSGITANIGNAIHSSPFGTYFHENGTPRQFLVDGENYSLNPIRDAYLIDLESINNNLFANFFSVVDFKFLEGLSYRINYSPNLRWSHQNRFQKQDVNLPNNTTFASKNTSSTLSWIIENIFKYEKSIGDNHQVDATMLYSRNKSENTSTIANSSLLSSDALGWNNLILGEVQSTNSAAQRIEGVSYMTRLNYYYKSNYMLTATVRSDGSSVFSENNKYAVFPSFAIGWNMSDESFISNSKNIDFLKLRFSFGNVGNQGISPYQSVSLLGTTQYVFGDAGSTSLGAYPLNIANNNLKWETTQTTNFGIDFRLFEDKLNGSMDLYNMKTTDLIVRRALPSMTGFSSILSNIGEVNNKGIELTLNSSNVNQGKFNWTSGFLFSHNINKIIHLYNSDTNGDGKEDDDIGNKWFIGYPTSVEFDYVIDGVYQEFDDLPADFKPGDIKLKDLNGDGIIDSEDRRIIGQNAEPKFRLGISNDFSLGDFTLSIFVNSMLGWVKSFPLTDRDIVSRSINFIDNGWWTPDNKSNTRPSLLYQNRFGHSYYLSRDFIRIQDVSLGYNLPKRILDKIGVSNFKISASGKNLKTFTKWLGPDPETGTNTYSQLYPMPRSITLGLNITL